MKRVHFILTVISLFIIIFISANFSHSETPSQYLLDEKVQTSECSDQFTEQEHFIGGKGINDFGNEFNITVYHCVKKGQYIPGQPTISISFLNFSVYSCSPFQDAGWFTDSQSKKISLCTNISFSQDSSEIYQSVFTESSCESLGLVTDASFTNSEGKVISHCIEEKDSQGNAQDLNEAETKGRERLMEAIPGECDDLSKEDCRLNIDYCDWVGERTIDDTSGTNGGGNTGGRPGCAQPRLSPKEVPGFCRDKPYVVTDVIGDE